jgi:TfoX N-terminal domain
MAYDEELADRIRELIAGERDVTEQRMFGGLAFLVGGNMSVAASGQGGLMVRVDPEDAAALLGKPHARAVRDARPRDAGLAASRPGGGANEAPARALGQARRRVRSLASSEALRADPRPGRFHPRPRPSRQPRNSTSSELTSSGSSSWSQWLAPSIRSYRHVPVTHSPERTMPSSVR